MIYDGRLAWKRSFGNKQKREFSDITVVLKLAFDRLGLSVDLYLFITSSLIGSC